ncbi:hypothetical protein ANN_23831 [Periplaneta americana]|uniref:DUF4817 domain-containing protein n=1 Tax=Periplaneta americana TaxID=6978 RepID=A0ABQ8SM64_PERAM|nr:hypothetical protein ANN_23831 [Periplaneta americana]
MSPGSNTDNYPAFAHIRLRENPGKELNQITYPDRKSNPDHLVSLPDTLTVTPQAGSPLYVLNIAHNRIRVLRSVAVDFRGTRAFFRQVINEEEYADIVYVYGLCDRSSLRAVAEYERRFPNRRVPYRRVFTVYGFG